MNLYFYLREQPFSQDSIIFDYWLDKKVLPKALNFGNMEVNWFFFPSKVYIIHIKSKKHTTLYKPLFFF